MNQGILITTWSGGEQPCTRLLESIKGIDYPVLIVVNDSDNIPEEWEAKLFDLATETNISIYLQPFDGFEIGAIRAALDHTDWDEFILLQDSIEIKNIEIFKILFDDYALQSVSYNPHFQMYLGKFRREVLNKLTLPVVRTKIEAVRQEELFTNEYKKVDPNIVVFNPRFRDENFYSNWEEIWGRKNLKLEDEYIIKRKGTWSANQL